MKTPFDSIAELILIIVPLICFVSSAFLYKRNNGCASKVSKLLFSSSVFVFVLLAVAYIVSDYFTGVGVNEAVLYHVRYGLSGAGFLEYWKIISIAVFLLSLGGFFLIG